MRTERPILKYPDPPLSDGRIRLRAWAPTDLLAVEQASNDPYIPEITSVPSPYSEETGLSWLSRQHDRLADGTGYPFCVADAHTDTAFGFVGLWLRNLSLGRAEIGYWVVPEARGRGVAVAAIRLLTPWAFKAVGIARIEILVEPHNMASQRVAERAGFAREGLLRSYVERGGVRRDAVMYALITQDIAS